MFEQTTHSESPTSDDVQHTQSDTSTSATAVDMLSGSESTQDDTLCYGRIEGNCWYCKECNQVLDSRVSPHKKKVQPTRWINPKGRVTFQMKQPEPKPEITPAYSTGDNVKCTVHNNTFIGCIKKIEGLIYFVEADLLQGQQTLAVKETEIVGLV